MRPLLWKLLFNYLGPVRANWPDELARSRASYRSFVAELTVNPYKNLDAGAAPQGGASSAKVAVSAVDDPLSVTVSNKWTQFYEDEQAREEIAKDVRRTHASFHFFAARPLPNDPNECSVGKAGAVAAERERKLCGDEAPAAASATTDATETSALRRLSLTEPASTDELVNSPPVSSPVANTAAEPAAASEGTDGATALARILFIYLKLNPCIGYVQGMNEVLAPMYYVFCTDKTAAQSFTDGVGDAEADAFFCFSALMADMRDRFIKSLDETPTGILAALRHLENVLRLLDPQLHHHLMVRNQVDPRFFAFRWLTLLLSQEFSLPDVLRLWDSVFADERRAEGLPFLSLVCVAMLRCVRDRLLAGEFVDNIQLLQEYPSPPVELALIIRTALESARHVDDAALRAIEQQHQQQQALLAAKRVALEAAAASSRAGATGAAAGGGGGGGGGGGRGRAPIVATSASVFALSSSPFKLTGSSAEAGSVSVPASASEKAIEALTKSIVDLSDSSKGIWD